MGCYHFKSSVLAVAVPMLAIIQTTTTAFSGFEFARQTDLTPSERQKCDPIDFISMDMKSPAGKEVSLKQATSISLWQDGRLYIGQRDGIVQVVEYDVDTMVTSSLCHSETMTDPRYVREDGTPSPRSVLGVTFDPRDKVGRPYISLSTLSWERGLNIQRSNKRAWANGAVVRLKPATAATRSIDGDQCLQFDKSILRNLPVSDGGHAINELVFTQSGDLLIAVGGNTNMGLPFGRLGGIWESYFSGAVLLARLSKGKSFKGDIPYTTPDNLRTAAPIKGYSDIEIYASGVRNLWAMAMARSGKIYALDQGPNCGTGNASSSCTEYVESEAEIRNTSDLKPFPGRAIVGEPGECRFGDYRPDKLIEIKKGKFYGHANIQRGVLTGKRAECKYVDPLTGRTPPPFNQSAPPNYEAPLGTLRNATSGISEYGSKLFCGQLRGDLIISLYARLGVYRTMVLKRGLILRQPEKFHDEGGIRVVENVHGDLIFPRFLNKPPRGIFVMRPRVTTRKGFLAVNALPFRHGRKGGTLLTIGGWGFQAGATVSVGNRNCAVVNLSSTEIVCRVPANHGSNRKTVKVSLSGQESVIQNAVLYMNV